MKIPPWAWILGSIALIVLIGTEGDTAVGFLMTAWTNSSNGRKWAPFLAQVEDAYGIPRGLLSRIAYQESSFRQDVIDGTYPSPAGALGMMQLMPQFFSSVQRSTPFTDADTQDQIREAADFLIRLYNHFQNWTAAVAAYNAGQGTIDKVIAGTRGLTPETANYIAQVSADLPHIVDPTLSA